MATPEVDVVILVGGKGTRLRPLTLSAPKPMLPTAGLPFLTHLLSRVAAAGIDHVILSTSYQAAVFEAEFGDGSKLGLQIKYVTEERPLGTGGGIANVAGHLRHDTVMVFNGDVLSGADLGQMLNFHSAQESDVTLHLVRVGDPRAFGCVTTEEGRVTGFLEKTQDPPTDQINAGCYVFSRQVIDRIPRGREVSVEREVFPALLSDPGVKVCGYVDASYWRDMGTPEDFVRGSADLVRGIVPSPALHGHRGEQDRFSRMASVHQAGAVEIDRHRDQHQNHEAGLAPGVEDDAGQRQKRVAQPLGKQVIGEKGNGEKEPQEHDIAEDHDEPLGGCSISAAGKADKVTDCSGAGSGNLSKPADTH